jgi:hypothetical protein
MMSLIPHVQVENGKLQFRPKQVRFSGSFVAAQIEGIFGQMMTKDGMGCAHEDLWCSHRRGRLLGKGDSSPIVRWSSSNHVL